MADIFNMTDTWNNGATVFSAVKMNVTDTASDAASKLLDLQVGGVSKLSADKAGILTLPAGGYSGYAIVFNGTTTRLRGTTNLFAVDISGSEPFYVTGSGPLSAGFSYGWCAGGSATADVLLARDAANTLAQRNGVNAQTKRTYGTYTDASNYRRVALAMTTAGVATLQAEGAGTGAAGNVLHISSLPTSNPGPGILWNNAGTPAIGT